MTNLIRTKQGKFTLKDSASLKDVLSGKYKLLKVEEVLDYKVEKVDTLTEKKIKTGQKLPNTYNINDKVIFLNQNNELLGIYFREENYLRVWKNFV